MIKRSLLISLILIGFFIGWEMLKTKANGSGDYTYLAFFLPFFLGIMIFTTYKTIKQQQEIWNSIVITVDDVYVSRQQTGMSETRIEPSQVTKIEENQHGLWIQTDSKTHAIIIPLQLEQADYLEIREVLSNWEDIKPPSMAKSAKEYAIAILFTLGMIVMLLSPFIWLSLLVGIPVIIYFRYSSNLIQNTPGIDPKYKKSTKFIYYWLIFMLVMSTFAKLQIRSFRKEIREESVPQQVILPRQLNNFKSYFLS